MKLKTMRHISEWTWNRYGNGAFWALFNYVGMRGYWDHHRRMRAQLRATYADKD